MAYAQRWHDRKVQLRIGSMVALLVLLALNVFVVPFTVAPDSAFARIVRDVLLSMILLSGVATVSDHHRLFVAIALVAKRGDPGALDRMVISAGKDAWTA